MTVSESVNSVALDHTFVVQTVQRVLHSFNGLNLMAIRSE